MLKVVQLNVHVLVILFSRQIQLFQTFTEIDERMKFPKAVYSANAVSLFLIFVKGFLQISLRSMYYSILSNIY